MPQDGKETAVKRWLRARTPQTRSPTRCNVAQLGPFNAASTTLWTPQMNTFDNYPRRATKAETTMKTAADAYFPATPVAHALLAAAYSQQGTGFFQALGPIRPPLSSQELKLGGRPGKSYPEYSSPRVPVATSFDFRLKTSRPSSRAAPRPRFRLCALSPNIVQATKQHDDYPK